MSTLAVIADIHGNMPALEAVIADLDEVAPDEILVGGDLVGRGPEGGRVVATVRERGWATIRGNHEDYLLDFRRGKVPDAWQGQNQWAASRWMAAELDEAAAEFLRDLPLTITPRIGEGLLLVHGSPASYNEGLGPWTPDSALSRHLRAADRPLLVCAHTHRPMHRVVAEGEVVNVGSVGLPFNGDRRAQYGLFHRDGGQWKVELRQVEYDLEEILAIYRSSGFSAAGGVTARLLELELRHAAAYLVPFLKWTAALGVDPEAERIDEFREIYSPGDPLHDLFLRLEALRRERRE
jgi:diadenosine tetraphosphatase ApaH/serine/threonine PP2A family protein phosphatase